MVYPRINDDWIFRESFDSVSSVIENGGSLVLGASLSNGILETTNSGNGATFSFLKYDAWLNGFSVRFRINFTDTDSSYRRFFFFGLDDNFKMQFAFHGGNNTLEFENRNGSGNNYYRSTQSSISSSTWYEIVVTWDGTDLVSYVDGGNAVTDSAAGSAFFGTHSNNYLNLEMGYATGETGCECDIDFFDFYDRALTAGEVTDIYNGVTFQEIDDSKALLSLPLCSNYEDEGGDQVTEDIGNTNSTIKLGDGTTVSTFPTQLAFSHGMSFDGGDYLEGANITITDGKVTCMAWIKLSSPTGAIIGNFESASPYTGFGFELDPGGTGVLSFYAADGTASSFTDCNSGCTVNDNQWHHCAVTYTGVTVRFYVDGTLTSQVARSHTLGNSSNVTHVGATTNSPINRYMTGNITKPKVYNLTLTDTQIKWIYEKEKRLINK